MLSNYAFVLILSVLAFTLPTVAVVLGWILGPKRPDVVKTSTYESGVETIGDTWVQFKAQYYLIGLIFLIFDVETIFLLPFAVAFTKLSIGGFIAMMIFLLLLVEGLFWAWQKGVLNWK